MDIPADMLRSQSKYVIFHSEKTRSGPRCCLPWTPCFPGLQKTWHQTLDSQTYTAQVQGFWAVFPEDSEKQAQML
jgi:hypothetical protein